MFWKEMVERHATSIVTDEKHDEQNFWKAI